MDVKSIVMVLLIAVVSMAFVGSASAATYYVNPGDSIQATINGAADGDTIILMDGDYVENVVVNKSVAIISEGVDEYYSEHGDTYARCWFWWIYQSSWDWDYAYDGAVAVAAAEDDLSVFTVESDNVLIMNIQVQIDDAGTDVNYYNYWCCWWWCIPLNKDVVTWTHTMVDNPMSITGAIRSDAAGVTVDGATGTRLINLITYGNDNGIALDGAVNTYINDVEMNDNDKEGLVAIGCDGIDVYDCVVVDSGKRGIEITESANVVIDTVLVLNSNKNGIDLEAVDGVLLDTVVVDGGAKTGVKIDDCTDVEVVYSYIVNNGRNGLTMADCDGTAVTDNEIAFNTRYGLKTHNAIGVTFDNNDVHDNGVDEKHFTSGSP